ncbi:PAS domain-containing hybrid sensor histidine kinase/response regulator, partial [Endothiovibrio diazotrophicus]
IARAHQHLLDHLGTVVFELDGEGRLLFLNRAWNKLTGFTVEESRGQALERWLVREGRLELTRALERLRGEEVLHLQLELPFVTRGGGERWCELSMDVVELESGAKGLSGRIFDISERRRTQQALRRAKEEAEVASRAKSAFLATMSHEIRTPMNAILGMTELLGETPMEGEQVEYLRILDNAGRNLLSLLDDLLDLSRVEAGRMELACEPFDAVVLVREAVDLLAPDARGKALTLKVDFETGLTPVRIGDAARVRQVLLNLVGNAIKFTASGWVAVRLTGERDPDGLHIEVEDTGIGLPDHMGERIFDNFTQGDSSITREYGGSGLGLSICKRLVELMGGRIWAENRREGGARFHLSLPLSPTEAVAVEPAGAPAPRLAAESGRALALLVVEDAEDNRLLIQSYLKRFPCRLNFATNGEEAVAKFKADRYDLVLMDMQMPVMDGYTATRRIRQWERERGEAATPVIALTAHAFSEDVQHCLDAGCDSHLSKPIKKSTLLQVLEEQRLRLDG